MTKQSIPFAREPRHDQTVTNFQLTPEVDQLLSQACIPLLTHLVDVFANGLPPRQMEKLLREAGRTLAADLSPSRPAL